MEQMTEYKIHINDDLCYENIFDSQKQTMSFSENKDLRKYKKDLREKFIELSGIDKIKKNECHLNITIETIEKFSGYTRIRYVFESENKCFVPCYLLIPDTGKEKYPVAIVMQGHSTGFHNSVGIEKFQEDHDYQPRGAFGLQAVKNGFAALCIEQRGMGERMSPVNERRWGGMCSYQALTAILIGRTIIGERIWDISKAIDSLENFEKCDTNKILITGNSGGGTISYYAAAYDERIKICVPSCSFCPYRESILNVYHCSCNYIPHIYEFCDMQDLAALIAPRNLVIIAGKDDTIFKLSGVQRGYETVKKIYKVSNAENNCKLLVTPKGHYWMEDICWNSIVEETKKLKWWTK